jgi:quinol monooxygenase YgiN
LSANLAPTGPQPTSDIVGLTIAYAWALDHRRFDDLAGIFTPDAVADFGRLGTVSGPAAIAEVVAAALAPYDRTQHIVTNHQIDLAGGSATGRCYVQAQHVWKEHGEDRNYTVAGSYLDRYRLEEGSWRISQRTLRVTWTDGSPPSQERAGSDTSFVIAGWIEVDPAAVEELLVAAVTMMAETRQEPGNLDYSFSADPAVPGRIRVFERWRSDADLRGHFDAPHMTVFQQALVRAGVRDRDLARFHVSGVGPVFEIRPA